MNDLDKIAEEASAEIGEKLLELYPHYPKARGITDIIKSACEKAIDDYDAELDKIQNGKGKGIIHESRAAHASEQLFDCPKCGKVWGKPATQP